MFKRLCTLLIALLFPFASAQAGLFDEIRLGPVRLPTYCHITGVEPYASYAISEVQWAEDYAGVTQEKFLAYGQALEEKGWAVQGEEEYWADHVRIVLTDGERSFLAQYFWKTQILRAVYWRESFHVPEDLLSEYPNVRFGEAWSFCGGIEVKPVSAQKSTLQWNETLKDSSAVSRRTDEGLMVLADFTIASEEGAAWSIWSALHVELHVYYDGVHDVLSPVLQGELTEQDGKKVIAVKYWLFKGETAHMGFGFALQEGLISDPSVHMVLKLGNPFNGEFCVIPFDHL